MPWCGFALKLTDDLSTKKSFVFIDRLCCSKLRFAHVVKFDSTDDFQSTEENGIA